MVNRPLLTATLLGRLRSQGVDVDWDSHTFEWLVDYAQTDPRRTDTSGYRTDDPSDAIDEARRMADAPLMPTANSERLIAEIAALKDSVATLQGEKRLMQAEIFQLTGRLDRKREGDSYV